MLYIHNVDDAGWQQLFTIEYKPKQKRCVLLLDILHPKRIVECPKIVRVITDPLCTA